MNKSIVGFLFLALVLSACEKTPDYLAPATDMIAFSAATGYENEPQTRTEYSGLDEGGSVITSTSTYERIDWVADYDRIRILCPQALDQSGDPNTSGDYQMSAPVAIGRQSQAFANPVTGTVPFYWGTGDHYFYALYPAPGTTSNYSDATVTEIDSHIVLSGNTASITGIIPASQTLVKNDTIYKPNMNYAYMYAALKTTQAAALGKHVTLTFHPLVNAFQFNLKALDDAMASKQLTSLTLKSSTSLLYGSFTAAIDAASATAPTVTPTDGTTGSSVEVTFPSGTYLSKTQYSIVTVLTLGVDQTDLTMELNFSDNTKRTIALNKNVGGTPTPITVHAGKKVYIRLGVPGEDVVTYYLDPLVNVSLSHTGGSAPLSEKPYKSYKVVNGGEPEAVSYSMKYSVDNGATWQDEAPEWCSTPVRSRATSDGKGIFVDMQPSENILYDPHHEILKAVTPKVNYDLSTLNVATGETVATSTANCYLVQGPGTYKFPLVYGNALKKGSPNPSAYQRQATSPANDEVNWLSSLKNHRGDNITQPYIMSDNTGKPVEPILIWSDAGGLIANLAITGTGQNAYMTFSVPAEKITQGNALLGLLVDDDDDGEPETIAWSWHIWVTEMPFANQNHAGVTNTYNNPPDKFAPYPLGFVDGRYEEYHYRYYKVKTIQDDPNGLTADVVIVEQRDTTIETRGNNVFYQWGRKDPMAASSGIGGSQKPYYTSDPSLAPSYTPDHQATLGEAIQHPNMFYFYQGNNAQVDWCSGFYHNLWNADEGTVGSGGTAMDNLLRLQTRKTVYDPCPVGYKVPSLRSFQGLTIALTPWVEGTAGDLLPGYRIYQATGVKFYATGSLGNPPTYYGAGDKGMYTVSWHGQGDNVSTIGKCGAAGYDYTSWDGWKWNYTYSTGTYETFRRSALTVFPIVDDFFSNDYVIDGHNTGGYYNSGDIDSNWR